MTKNLPKYNALEGVGTVLLFAISALVIFVAGGVYTFSNQDKLKNLIADFSQAAISASGFFQLDTELKVLSPARFLSTIFFGETDDWLISPLGDASFKTISSQKSVASSVEARSVTTDYLTVTRSETIAGLNADFLDGA